MTTSWTIITTKHTFFIAEGLALGLKRWFSDVKISMAVPDKFGGDMYIMLCPQHFQRHPPAERTVFFQLEQWSSPHWWTPQYLALLSDKKYCAAVFDYSTKNLEFLSGKGIGWPRTYHMPVGCIEGFRPGIPSPAEKEVDLIFYGAVNSPRRERALAALREKFSVRVISSLFGNELYAELRKARAVVNLHYQDDAVLETPRLCECISLGVPVISESAADMTEYPELVKAVRFFPRGRPESAAAAVGLALANLPTKDELAAAAAESQSKARFHIDRFLLANGLVRQQDVEPWLPKGDLVLTMPETPERYAAAGNIPGASKFPGLRGPPGWVGCGRSYGHIGRNARAGILVVEDDVLLPKGWTRKLEAVRKYLAGTEWDVFSGFQSDLSPDAAISDIATAGGVEYVHLDRMVSTVCNIYNSRALGELAKWNDGDRNAARNTVDRFLEAKRLKVVAAHPFIAGHREDMSSTLWAGNNGELYAGFQAATNKMFAEKISVFKNNHP